MQLLMSAFVPLVTQPNSTIKFLFVSCQLRFSSVRRTADPLARRLDRFIWWYWITCARCTL